MVKISAAQQRLIDEIARNGVTVAPAEMHLRGAWLASARVLRQRGFISATFIRDDGQPLHAHATAKALTWIEQVKQRKGEHKS
jgi:hypothetical protein